ncbi:C39 family peptidase [Methanothermobacter thermautotrophicus]|uniref:C39 family peptidase n=1 Tax=Methanothermobacter thermautotrophicus TaxID=145262 RepID=UPI003D7F99F6
MVSVSSAAAADNSTMDATACTDKCKLFEAHGDAVAGAPAPDDNVTVDSDGMVLQASNYTCGPAALATILQRLGVNTTEDELAELAGTTEDGTTMQGLLEAARAMGMNATGMRLSISELRANMIAYTISDGIGHYTVINEITGDTVKLADPSLGNIEMSIDDFAQIYSGNALVITAPKVQAQEVNKTESNENTNLSEPVNNLTDTSSTDVQTDNRTLTDEEMQNIKGKCWQFLAPVTIGTIIISVRNKYVPKKYWCYFAYHPPFKKVRAYIGKTTRSII